MTRDERRTELTTGEPVTPEALEIDPSTGQQRGYVVLAPEERAKGFVRPVRRSYRHVGLSGEGCGTVTTMGWALAETYAHDPSFYGATFCCGCGEHLPVGEFVWDTGTDERVGS